MAISCDGWTAIDNSSFLGVTAHYIDKSFRIHCITIGLEHILESHTSENLAEILEKCIHEYNIKPVAVVTDNAYNIVKAVNTVTFQMRK